VHLKYKFDWISKASYLNRLLALIFLWNYSYALSEQFSL